MSNQCIVSSVVYDWLTFDECIKKTKLIPDVAKKCILDDCICINFNVNCLNNEPTVIWEAIGMVVNTATFSIKHCGPCDNPYTILVNDEIVASVTNDSIYQTEVTNLRNISVIREGEFYHLTSAIKKSECYKSKITFIVCKVS
ncbi:hypothetical protein F9U64_10935 [Gracilibacillus oryzae]|uniref:Endospore appendages core domain-containing protein n=1 Tax=Gracilibacillus oryzae TaxID=1672701 RepID=A0A7C8KZ72_9BACI|nr:S-Ena type endospore appendage [Gracilibacillus oryzae]KAB8135776.1 hypothetical protein F9U64_10935 [Gracilibacillus oryzae]